MSLEPRTTDIVADTMSVQEDADSPTVGSRRPRHQYTSQACDRCRSRKQRCIRPLGDESSCKNCLNSSSHCAFSTDGRAKRMRKQSTSRSRSEDVQPQPGASLSFPSASPDFPSMPIGQPQAQPMGSQGAQMSQGTPQTINSQMNGSMGVAANPFAAAAIPQQSEQRTGIDWGWLNGAGFMQQMEPFLPATHMTLGAPNTMPAVTPLSSLPASTTNTVPSWLEASSQSGTSQSAASPVNGQGNEQASMFEAAKGLAMISLEASAEPHYLGESSGSLWSTLIAKGMPVPQLGPNALLMPNLAQHPSRPHLLVIPPALLRQQIQRPLSDEVSAKIVQAVYQHLQPRYAFMDWLAFEKQWAARKELLVAVGQERQLDRHLSTAAFFILMVLAVGAQLIQDPSVPGLLRPEEYYALAGPYLGSIVQLHTLSNVQALLLLSVYSLRDSRGPSVWYLAGVTMRLCTSLGLHRKAVGRSYQSLSKHQIEMRKRVFWSCYTFDRMFALLLGRPPGISDDDLDIDLPDETPPPVTGAFGDSSMISFVHYIKLMQLESRIQRAVYTINPETRRNHDTLGLLNEIDEWETKIPPEAAEDGCWAAGCCTRDWFQLRGIEARLHLLRPLCSDTGPTSQRESMIPHLARHAARGCEIQKRYHHSGQPRSNASIHSTFICGLALLYAVILQPTSLPVKDVMRAIMSASNTLFAYSHSNPTAEILYDVFEKLSAVCIEQISEGRRTAENLNSGMDDWQKLSNQATSEVDFVAAREYVDFFKMLGLSIGEERSGAYPFSESPWDVGSFTTANMFDGSG